MRKLLITGAGGFVGGNLAAMAENDWETHAVYHTIQMQTGPTHAIHRLDITDKIETDRLICEIRPDAIIHCAAVSQFDYCFQHRDAAEKTNISGTLNIARAANKANAKLVFLSTDLVFKGDKGPYSENDVPDPCCVYGKTKRVGEKCVESVCSEYSIARIALVYGQSMSPNKCFAETVADTLEKGDHVRLFTDEFRSPIYVGNLCDILLELAERNDLNGLFHVCGNERISRFDFGRKLARIFGFDENLIVPVSMNEFHFMDKRPNDCSMKNGNTAAVLKTPIRSVSDGLEDMRRIRLTGKRNVAD